MNRATSQANGAGRHAGVRFPSTAKPSTKKRKKKRKSAKTKLPKRGHKEEKPVVSKKLDNIDPEKLLAGLAFDDDAIAPIVAAGGPRLFKNAPERDVAKKAIAHWRKHKKAPGEQLYESVEGAEALYLLSRIEQLTCTTETFADAGFAAFERDDVYTERDNSIEPAEPGHPPTGRLTIRRADTVKPRSLQQVMPGVLYRGKVTIVVGDPDVGKSLSTCDTAARITRADGWWQGRVKSVIPPSHVVMLSGEDDTDDTIVPRLIAAGADLSKIDIIEDVVKAENGELSVLSIDEHLDEIHDYAVSVGAALVTIDPIGPFMGARDSHKDSSVRAVISRIRQYAIEGNYAVEIVAHFNKPGERLQSAIHRVMGSLAFVAAPRSVFAFTRDPANPDYRLFLPIKANLSPDRRGYRCRIESDQSQRLKPPPGRLVWDKDAVEDQQIDDVLAQASPREQANRAKKQEIKDWLYSRVLPGKRVPSKKFNEEAKQHRYDEKSLREVMAKEGLERTGKKGTWPTKWYVRRSKQ